MKKLFIIVLFLSSPAFAADPRCDYLVQRYVVDSFSQPYNVNSGSIAMRIRQDCEVLGPDAVLQEMHR
jgi:hypothetical protein